MTILNFYAKIFIQSRKDKIKLDEIKKEKPKIRLNYRLKTPEERNEYVKNFLKKYPEEYINNKTLEILSDYIISAIDKQERKKKKILTDNRMITINRRETSFQGLAESFESGEDGIYNLITNDKNIIFMPKISITKEDLEEIPGLKELRSEIEKLEETTKTARGKRKYLLKKQIIEMRQEQYILKSGFRKPICFSQTPQTFSNLPFEEDIYVDVNGEPHNNCIISLFNPSHIRFLLKFYSKLKEECYGKFWTDLYFLMEDLDGAVAAALKEFPLYLDLLIYKIDGLTNLEIQSKLSKDYNTTYTVEYLSSLWANKIPKMIAEQVKKDYIVWYYTFVEKGQWKKCSKCGQTKLAHKYFFSRNNKSSSGFYSICKECRRKKKE